MPYRPEYYQKNKVAYAERYKKYYSEHKKYHALRSKKYRETHSKELSKNRKDFYERNKNRLLQQKKKYYLENIEEKRLKAREHFKLNKQKIYAYRNAAYENDPSIRYKMIARNKFRQALLSGKLQKRPCIVCETMKDIHAHHEDYSKPLDVIWLCREHHFEKHRKGA